jgi:hypothetical protein
MVVVVVVVVNGTPIQVASGALACKVILFFTHTHAHAINEKWSRIQVVCNLLQ